MGSSQACAAGGGPVGGRSGEATTALSVPRELTPRESLLSVGAWAIRSIKAYIPRAQEKRARVPGQPASFHPEFRQIRAVGRWERVEVLLSNDASRAHPGHRHPHPTPLPCVRQR